MAARRESGGGGGIAGVLGVLFVLGVVIKYIWWIVGIAAVIGVSIAVYHVSQAALRRAEERRELAERHEEELRLRAERQRRWTLLGDSRAVYGEDGAGPTRAIVSPEATSDLSVARIAATPAERAALMRDRPRAWQHALFASVLQHRTAAMVPRLRDSELGFTTANGIRISSGAHLASHLTGLIDEMLMTTQQLSHFMNSPGFMAAFGDAASTTDAAALEQIAHRVADYAERLLELSERCRALSPPSRHTALVTDCARLLDMPLQGYRAFVTEYVDVVDALPRALDHARGSINLGSIALDMEVDDALFARTQRRLAALSQS